MSMSKAVNYDKDCAVVCRSQMCTDVSEEPTTNNITLDERIVTQEAFLSETTVRI